MDVLCHQPEGTKKISPALQIPSRICPRVEDFFA